MKLYQLAFLICSTNTLSSTLGDDLVLVTLLESTREQNFTSGLFWDYRHQVLFFIDRRLGDIHRLDPLTGQDQTIRVEGNPTFIIPTRDVDRRFIINEDNKVLYLFWPYDSVSGFYTECLIANVDPFCPGNDLNDGNADAEGRVWAASLPALGLVPGEYANCTASLYRFDTRTLGKVEVTPILRPITFGNDMAWTQDNSVFYFVESEDRCVYSFKFDLENGVICCGRTVFCFCDFNVTGQPDGLTIDLNGDLWIAANGAGLILNVKPATRQLLRTVSIPARAVNDVEFGGAAMDILYVSTRNDGRPDEPLAGSIFQVTGLKVFGSWNNYAVMNSDCTPEFFK